MISCVGHETDFTISDFVADVRAATPSMAAEIAVPVVSQLRRELESGVQRVANGLRQLFSLRRAELMRICERNALSHPAQILIEGRRENLDALSQRSDAALKLRMEDACRRMERTCAKLEALNPALVLERGYACISGGGRILSSVSGMHTGMQIEIRMRDGVAAAQVLHTQNSERQQ